METGANSKTKMLESFFSDLSPEHAFLLSAGEIIYPQTAAPSMGQKLLEVARILSKLPDPSWLHLCNLDNEAVYVVIQTIDQDERLFLTFPSSTRISQLEEKLVVLKQRLGSQKAEPLREMLEELGAADLKSELPAPTRSDALLSLLSDFDTSAPQADQNQTSQGDTQPVTL